MQLSPPLPQRLRLRPMLARDPHEGGRVASSLELFFDLTFVVAVSSAGGQLHKALSHGEVAHGIVGYAMAFFAIWWAWMNFTWFATSFDTDDWLYRVTTIVQMGGVLVLAAGIPGLFASDGTGARGSGIALAGYVLMRLPMVSQWVRAGTANPSLRRTAWTYAGGITAVQILWVLTLLLPLSLFPFAFAVLAACEIAVPVVAERGRHTPWHPHHITERYGRSP